MEPFKLLLKRIQTRTKIPDTYTTLVHPPEYFKSNTRGELVEIIGAYFNRWCASCGWPLLLRTITFRLYSSIRIVAGLGYLLCSFQVVLLWAQIVVSPQKGRTADWGAETPSSAAADAASPWEWIGLLSGSPSWCLENCRRDKKKKKKRHKRLMGAAFRRSQCSLWRFDRVPAAQLKGPLWPAFRFRPGVDDLTHRHSLGVWGERGERQSAFMFGTSCLQFLSLFPRCH